MPNVYEQVKQALQDIVAPNLAKIEGKIEAISSEMHSEFKRLDEKIDSLRREMDTRFREMDTRFEAIDKRINSLEDKLETGLEFRDRFAALEAKVAALTAR